MEHLVIVAIICGTVLAMGLLITHKGIAVKVKTETILPEAAPPQGKPIRAITQLTSFGRAGHPTVVDDEHEVLTAKEDRSVKTHFSQGLEKGFEGEGWD
jgi:hypothetical protein